VLRIRLSEGTPSKPSGTANMWQDPSYDRQLPLPVVVSSERPRPACLLKNVRDPTLRCVPCMGVFDGSVEPRDRSRGVSL
jgi:hypothetical protein